MLVNTQMLKEASAFSSYSIDYMQEGHLAVSKL